ncbi:MAG: DUF6599 family protein [Acidobacteriota bacterium]
MKKNIIFLFLFFLVLGHVFPEAETGNGEELFPVIKDFKAKGDIETYTPDTLFEYINGAADLFLSYDFRKLYSRSYKNEREGSLTIDIYRHRDIKNCFGIYSQEKPDEGKFLETGVQGYYEEGVLNFFKGPFYVKISSFDLGKDDYSVLYAAASGISDNIMAEEKFPEVLRFFPEKGKVENSEKYINVNFMGHSFLHSSFIADYKFENREGRIFIIDAESESGSEEIIKKYTAFIMSKGEKIFKSKGGYIFADPYYRSSGKMYIRIHGRYVYGLFCTDDERALFYLEQIKKRM